jgi:RNA polymerase sigma-70 factor (ECF subfamily)
LRPGEQPTLIQRLQDREDAAAAELVSAYRQRIYQLAFRHVRNHEDAEEVTQDVLMKVFRNVGSFRGDAALTSWIYRITFNAAISHLRRQRARGAGRHVPLSTESGSFEDRAAHEEIADAGEAVDRRLLRSELRRQLASAVNELPPLYRAPVILRDIRGLSTEQASVMLRVKSQTLKSRLHRGRTLLRQRLERFASPEIFAASQAA